MPIDFIPIDFLSADFLLAAAAVFAAGLIRGFAGFGSALINAPVLSLLWGPLVGVPVAALIEIAPAIQLTVPALKIADRRVVLALALPALLLIPLGSWLLVSIPAADMRRGIAGVVLVLVAVLWSGWRYRGRRTTPVTAAVGALGGLLSGTTGMGGPPAILYLMSSDDAPARIRANLVGYFTIIFVGLVVSYVIAGLITADVLWRIGLLAPVFIVGIAIGARLFGLATERVFRNIALCCLTLSALWVLAA